MGLWSDASRTTVRGRSLTGPNPTKVLFRRDLNRRMLGLELVRSPRWCLRRRTSFLVIETKPALILVEDDLSVLRALRRLMLSAGFQVMVFDRPSAVLDSDLPNTNACLVVDVHLPERSGWQPCEPLAAPGAGLRVIMTPGRLDEATRELARHAKAFAV